MDIVLSILIGLGLAAACGFRVFVPLLILAVATRSGAINLSPSLLWLASDGALVALSVASLLEVAAYWVPWVDHALDVVATPAAVVAGTIAAAGAFSFTNTPNGEMLKWAAAAIAGGGLAGAVQLSTVVIRGASTLTTGGLANPLFATMESGLAIGTSVFAVVVPLAAGLVVLSGIALVLLALILRRRQQQRHDANRVAITPVMAAT